MTVKINGVSFDTKRVMRFAPHRMGGLDFRPEDVTTLEELERLKAEFKKLPDSDFDKRQMSQLIDNCIQDCKNAGVETASPSLLSELKDEWEAGRKGHGA